MDGREATICLGESRRTIARFNQPQLPSTTASLEALKDLTEGERMTALGRGPQAVSRTRYLL